MCDLGAKIKDYFACKPLGKTRNMLSRLSESDVCMRRLNAVFRTFKTDAHRLKSADF